MARPETPLVTTDAIIPLVKDGEPAIVMIKRKNPPPGWALPGGFVDLGETVEAACVREAKEETNLDIKVGKIVGVYSDPARDPRGHTVTVAYLCKVTGAEADLLAQDDAAEVGIFTKSEVDALQVAFDHKKIIEDSGVFARVF
ncbi:MAG: NUDIX domain-containing protein [Promethearchaeota archaeon]